MSFSNKTSIALTDDQPAALIDRFGNVLIYTLTIINTGYRINGFYVDAKGGMHYTYFNPANPDQSYTQ